MQLDANKDKSPAPTAVNTMLHDRNLLMKRTNNFLKKGKCTYRSTSKDQGFTTIESQVLCKNHKHKEIKCSRLKIIVQ